MDAQHYDETDQQLGGDLLVGANQILRYLIWLGLPPDTDVYYLRRARRWPIGKNGGGGAKPLASKRKLARHVDELTRGNNDQQDSK